MDWKYACNTHCRLRKLYIAGKLSRKEIAILESYWWWNPEIQRPAKSNKETLLEMAKLGKTRPTRSSYLGKQLIRYTGKHDANYDQDFSQQIRRIRPSWFLDHRQKSMNKLKEVIKWTQKMGKVPSVRGKTAKERRLAAALGDFRKSAKGQKSRTWHPEYQEMCEAAGLPGILQPQKPPGIDKIGQDTRMVV